MLEMKNGNLLVSKVEAKNVTQDGIIMTNDQGMHSFEGIVQATFDEYQYPVNCRVLFYDKAGEEVWIDGKKYLMVDSENIWAKRKEIPCHSLT